jgi:hypothetical protein
LDIVDIDKCLIQHALLLLTILHEKQQQAVATISCVQKRLDAFQHGDVVEIYSTKFSTYWNATQRTTDDTTMTKAPTGNAAAKHKNKRTYRSPPVSFSPAIRRVLVQFSSVIGN